MKKQFFKLIYNLTGNASPNFVRYIFIGVAFLGIIGFAIKVSLVIEKLDNYSKATTEIYAQLISEALFDKMGTDFAEHLVLEQIISDFDMPIIITDMQGRLWIWKNISIGSFFWKKKISYDDDSFYTREQLKRKMKELRKDYEPKLIYGRDKKTQMGFLYYGDSSFIQEVSLMPFYEFLFIVFFTLAIYLVVKSVLVTEKGNLWVGLAKETAHQLGTPLTSLKGWIEYLQIESGASRDSDLGFGIDDEFPQKVENITHDMAKDVARLEKVTNRFSLIGSLPALKTGDLQKLLEDHISYFSKRLPTLGKKIEVEYSSDELPPVKINSDLLSWVFENLFKNSLDAMDGATGKITIEATYVSVDKMVRISHKDTGKGISWDSRNAVFTPGYTTKKRGWGLGLSLAKRIVEEYHRGRIYISWSQKGKGTEFVIELPALEGKES